MDPENPEEETRVQLILSEAYNGILLGLKGDICSITCFKYALLHPIKSIQGLYFVLFSKTARTVTASTYPFSTLVI